jgi:hypothetical protein
VMLAILVGLGVKQYRRDHPANHSTQPELTQSVKK